MKKIMKLFLISILSMTMQGSSLHLEDHITDNDKETITFDLLSTGKPVKNIFSDINVWDFRSDWTYKSDDHPSDYFFKNYPFVKRVQFMTATGGNAERDLFISPDNRSVLSDYKFDVIIEALHNVTKQGLIPMIKTGAVPLKYSVDAEIRVFGVNVKPPYDYDIYYNYINALANKIVTEFGINEVKDWVWGVLTEYENKDWYSFNDNPELTKVAFFKLYDYTVAALEDVIGKENLIVGAHGMVCNEGLWDELEFIDHVAKGTNYKTGEIGTKIDFLAASFYDLTPGVSVKGNLDITNTIEVLRNRAIMNGLTDLKYGIDEGRILNGPNGRPLLSRIVAHSFQAAADARLFKTMNNIGADWFTTWGLSTQRFWGGVTSVGTHIARLTYKMVGEQELLQTSAFNVPVNSNEIDGMATYNDTANTMHVMIYNYNKDINDKTTVNQHIKVENIQPLKGSEVIIRQWLVDDKHGNYWPSWHSDMKSRGITDDSFHGNWSSWSVEAPLGLINQEDREFWYSNEAKYKELATLEVITTKQEIKNNMLLLSVELDHHGVVFYEIENVKPIQKN